MKKSLKIPVFGAALVLSAGCLLAVTHAMSAGNFAMARADGDVTYDETTGKWSDVVDSYDGADTPMPAGSTIGVRTIAPNVGDEQITFYLSGSDYGHHGSSSYYNHPWDGSQTIVNTDGTYKWQEFNWLDNILLYTSETDYVTLGDARNGLPFTCRWTHADCIGLALKDEYKTSYTKVVIPKDTVFPSLAYCRGAITEAKGFTTPTAYVFEGNATDGYTRSIANVGETTVNKVRQEWCNNRRLTYIGVPGANYGESLASQAINSSRLAMLNFYDYVFVDDQKLSDLMAEAGVTSLTADLGNSVINLWTRWGTFCMNLTGIGGYGEDLGYKKIEIKKGAQFPAMESLDDPIRDPGTAGSTPFTTGISYVEVDQDYVFVQGDNWGSLGDGNIGGEGLPAKNVGEAVITASESETTELFDGKAISIKLHAPEVYHGDSSFWEFSRSYNMDPNNCEVAEGIFINGKSIHEINKDTDDSAYTYDSSCFPWGRAEADFDNPIIIRTEGNGFIEIRIWHEYLATLGNTVTISMNGGPTGSYLPDDNMVFYHLSADFEALLWRKPYTVSFDNDGDGVVDSTEEVGYGLPVARPAAPTKEADAQYTYSFEDWYLGDTAYDFTSPIEGDITLTAHYSETLNSYTAKFMNGDVQVGDDQTVEYGSAAVVPTEVPTKEADAAYTYTFKGWADADGNLIEDFTVTGDVTYYAYFDKVANEYTAKFVDAEGVETEIKFTVENKAEKLAELKALAHEDDAQYDYEVVFPDELPLEDITITETRTVKKYTVTWKDADGNVLETDADVEYGATVAFDGETPTKEADSEYTYEFEGWLDAEGNLVTDFTVTGDAVYTASFKATAIPASSEEPASSETPASSEAPVSSEEPASSEESGKSGGGCGGVIAATGAAVVVLGGAAIALALKRRKEDK